MTTLRIGTRRSLLARTQAGMVADLVRDRLGCDVELSGDATADPRSYRVDFTRIATSLPEFGCRWNVRSGASQLVHAYSSVGLTYEDFVEMGRYTRLAQLKRLVAGGRLDEDLRWVDESAHLPVDASDPTGA